MSQIRRIVGEVENFTEDLIRRLATNIHAELVSPPPVGTPVDTGWARANWIPQIGVPFTGNSQQIEPSPGEVAQAGARQQSGLASVFTYRLALGNVFISNNVPYILNLNDGSSTQSPRMFIETAIENGIRRVLTGIAR